MLWFERLFSPLMLLWPVVAVLCVRPVPERATAAAPALTRRAVLATLVALLLLALLEVAAEVGLEGTLVLWRGWRTAVPVTGSLLLWFGFAMPALRARSPGWGEPQAAAPRRSASLAPRHVAPALPGWAWMLGWTLWVGSLASMAWAVSRGAPAALLLAALFFPGFATGSRFVSTEAEPRDAGGSAELDAAYASLRRFRAWSFWWVGVLGSLAFGALALITPDGGPSAGLVGGLLGAGVGVLGAVLGTLASVKRARVNALLTELDRAGG